MTQNNTLSKYAKMTGQYYLIEVEDVLKIYEGKGYDVNDEELEVPNVLDLDGEECFFTGDHIARDGKYFEIVIAAKDFKWDEVVHDEEEGFDEE